MARKTEYGKFIISAGEIGAYSVCPEAWRLSMIERVKALKDASTDRGATLHKAWARSYDDAVFFTKGVKLIIALVFAAIAFHLLTS
jgi:hypothetical protein